MGKLAFVFAGQGSQAVGMGGELCEYSAAARRVFEMADEALRRVIREGPEEALNLTLNAQPAVFLMDLACAAALNENGVYADGVAGFSLGEVPAAAYCGLLDERRAYEFVRFRAQAMHRCSEQNPGGMLAVLKLTAEDVERVCSEIEGAYPVNYNCEGQTVVACAEHSFPALQAAVAARGGRGVRLAVSGAFHCPFMDKASADIAEYLKKNEFIQNEIPIYSNVTAMPYGEPSDLLARQVNHPVLWQRTVENMVSDGFDTFVEVGPGKTLTGLIKRIAPGVGVYNVSDSASLKEFLCIA